MSQTPNPHDPYGTAPDSSAPQTPTGDVPAPTSDPALHPHDPYAYDPAAHQAQAAPAEPADQGAPSEPGPYAAPQDPGHAEFGGGVGGTDQYGQGVHTTRQAGASDLPPADVKGVYEGPLSGQPASASDTKLWSMLAHLSAIAGYILGVGWLGWLGPLIIFLVFKDRNRYVRYNAAEALNAAITVIIASVVLWIGIGILGVITFSVGWLLFPIAYIPALIHGIFAIIAAVKVNEGTWWNYPVNLRMFK